MSNVAVIHFFMADRIYDMPAPKRNSSPLILIFSVRSGRSCPLPLTLLLTGKGTASSRAANPRENGTRLQPGANRPQPKDVIVLNRADIPVNPAVLWG